MLIISIAAQHEFSKLSRHSSDPVAIPKFSRCCHVPNHVIVEKETQIV